MANTHIRFDWAIKKLLRNKANYVVLDTTWKVVKKERNQRKNERERKMLPLVGVTSTIWKVAEWEEKTMKA